MECDDIAVVDDNTRGNSCRQLYGTASASLSPFSRPPAAAAPPSPVTKTRSLSDGGNSTPGRSGRLSPPPLLLGTSSRPSGSKDDISIGSASNDAPVTPRRPAFRSFHTEQSRVPFANDPMQISQTPQKDDTQLPSTPVATSSSGAHLIHQQLQQQQHHLYHNQPTYMAKPTPLSPKLDPSQIYASPTNILPRRSRGLDFSRAATSLHHSTLAEQSSPESSPVAGLSGGGGGIGVGSDGNGAMNIPGRKSGDYTGTTEPSTSLWSMMGRNNQDKMVYPSSSLGSSVNHNLAACSDSSSSSDEDDFMDEDTEEPFITTPQVGKTMGNTATGGPAPSWMPPSSPAMNSLLSFTHRQRPRKQPKRKVRGPLGLGFSSTSTSSAAAAAGVGANNSLSRSPPTSSGASSFLLGRDANQATAAAQSDSRRESISWAANQLHISGSESDDNLKAQIDVGDALGQRGVIRRVVTRRGNLLPKTKGFARIRAALAEESAPAEADSLREAEVVRQVLDNDMDHTDHQYNQQQQRLPEPPLPIHATTATAHSSPGMFDNLDDLADDVMAMDASSGLGLGFDSSNKNNSNGKAPVPTAASSNRMFWNRINQQPSSGSLARPERIGATTPPPLPPARAQLRSYSTSSTADDALMDSPGYNGGGGGGGDSRRSSLLFPNGAIFPMTTASSSGGGTPQTATSGGPGSADSRQQQAQGQAGPAQQHSPGPLLPSAAEITRRINSKRRRDDGDLDPMSFKRRAVSPSISVHNSPVMQSPLQRDVLPWGGQGGPSNASRPGSGSGGIGSIGLFDLVPGNSSGGGGNGSNAGSGNASTAGRGGKGRVGYQAMVDTNDSITRLSIE